MKGAEKKADKLLNQLSSIKSTLITALKPIGELKSTEPKNITNSIATIILKVEKDSKNDIESGEFISAETRINNLSDLSEIIDKMAKFFIDYDQLTSSYNEALSELMEKSSSILSIIDEINNI